MGGGLVRAGLGSRSAFPEQSPGAGLGSSVAEETPEWACTVHFPSPGYLTGGVSEPIGARNEPGGPSSGGRETADGVRARRHAG